ncbi:protein ECERIFERUM 26-like [Ziziphus jujuba]|uniref:Protein ECERIFERUM 26-like n=1 Tax=Ziziphus jujuba TaxID=326968 RepID=A0A6P4A2E2_ZIZJJ|nr:protein ECERIFERUM 26-like [Ziziphus jujuba]
MVFSKEESLVYGFKLSSVGPGKVSGTDVVHELSSMDLAMKLHYLRGVYFFDSQAVQGLTIHHIKETMFTWFNEYYHTCGRFRRSDGGRPYIKCNDCGARFIEAQCDRTIDEWLGMKDWSSLQNLLVSQQVIGPELSFSPPVLLQITYFKCGGLAFGLSWAHVLGDAFSAIDFINRWGQIMALYQPNAPPPNTELENFENSPGIAKELPLSLKRVDPVGDHWITPNNSKMELFSFTITPSQITHFQMKVMGPIFESLCAIIWKSIATIRQDGSEPKTVSICKNDHKKHKSGKLSNSLTISTVKTDISVPDADPNKLAKFLVDQAIDETTQIKEAVEKDQGVSDFVVYGANLTFVDFQEADLYGLEFQGHKPIFASYTIQGVGDKGVVLVLPGPPIGSGKNGGDGILVTVILPEGEILELKSELRKNDLLLENTIE